MMWPPLRLGIMLHLIRRKRFSRVFGTSVPSLKLFEPPFEFVDSPIHRTMRISFSRISYYSESHIKDRSG